MITCNDFLDKYHITSDEMADSGFSWDELMAIHEDFSRKREGYRNLLDQFQRDYLDPLLLAGEGERPVVHSLHSRVKDPEHLMAKAVRRRRENFKKYRGMDVSNYERFFTDLAGVRCLLLFKADWQKLHAHLVSAIDDDSSLYVNNRCLEMFDPDPSHVYHAEQPKVHIRNGDDDKIYKELLSPEQVSSGKVYRSAHYIVKYGGIYLEIQARTLFEESWGEIDHAVVYPYHTDDPVLKEYTELLNRLSGLADEMASFFVRIQEIESELASVQKCPISQATDGEKATVPESPVCIEAGFSDNISLPDDAGTSPLGIVESIVRSE